MSSTEIGKGRKNAQDAKSDKRAGVIYIVATPIGNLSEITERALDILRTVDVIACEDTRHSLKLLNHFEIKKPLVAYHKFNEREQTPILIERALKGERIAVISDAGMPAISDPGGGIAARARANGVEVTVVSGACALVNAVVLAGLDTARFCFLGFLPTEKKQRRDLIQDFAALPVALIVYSAPHDLAADLKSLHAGLGARRAVLVKELTKMHESATEFVLGKMPDVDPRGEFVIVVEGGKRQECPLNALEVEAHVRHYIETGLDKMTAIKRTANDRGVAKSEIYKSVVTGECDIKQTKGRGKDV